MTRARAESPGAIPARPFGARGCVAWLVAVLLSAGLLLTTGCRDKPKQLTVASSKVVPSAPPWASAAPEIKVPLGMAYIPGGPLVAGTPPDALPRVADEEMAGQQVILKDFFIDIYAYPNEQGAIPLTNVTQAEAARLCEQREKRLCSELEWERACKGPENKTYGYGDTHRSEVCGTGKALKLIPSGYRVACRSDFGVHDLHGSAWEWTDSPWGRGSTGGLVSIRGGNGEDGDRIARCANARPMNPGEKSPDLGFRCCSGPRNQLEVSLEITRGTALIQRNVVDRKLAKVLEESLPQEIKDMMRERGVFRINKMWYWHPIGNEELLVSGGCAGADRLRRCGVVVARQSIGKLEVMAWADSGVFIPTVRVHGSPRDIWVYGGDAKSHYRRRVIYAWGRIKLGRVERNVKMKGE